MTPMKDLPASWQSAQSIGGVTAGWFIVAPAKLEYCVGMWHASQAALSVGMCVGGRPLADTLLWQLAQPLMMPLWLNTAPAQPMVEWQASHSSVVSICVGPLPCACTPLWQEEQLPRTSTWSKFTAGLKATGV